MRCVLNSFSGVTLYETIVVCITGIVFFEMLQILDMNHFAERLQPSPVVSKVFDMNCLIKNCKTSI